jgi:arsenate reductase
MSDTFPVTIYHNPNCGTSRNVVALVQAAGYAPKVIEYLKAGWTRDQLTGLLTKAGLTARDLLREKGTPAAELGLLGPGVGEDAILDAMVAHPILVNRPVVETRHCVRLCRPSEAVLPLLERAPATFAKEDGEVVRGTGA